MSLPSRPAGHNRLKKNIRLQETLYSSRNPTRRWLHHSRRQWLIEAVSRYFPDKGEMAVDAGSGSFPLAYAISGRFNTMVAFDREPAFLKHASRRLPQKNNLHFIAGDLKRIPMQNDGADLVICSEVLEHVSQDLVCLNEIHRILKPAGLLILTTPQPFSILEIIARLAFLKPVIPLTRVVYREPVLPPGHINLITTGELAEKLTSAGFTILKKHKSGLYIPGLAEIPLPACQKLAERLNAVVSDTMFDFLLWTQFFVARKQAPPRRQKKPEKRRPETG